MQLTKDLKDTYTPRQKDSTLSNFVNSSKYNRITTIPILYITVELAIGCICSG